MTLVVLASCGKGGGNEGNNGDDNGGGVTPTHAHKLSPIKEQAATCVAAGNKAYYICTGDKGCGKYFWDANGLNEITDARDVATPLAPHEYIDGVCKNCGKKKPTEGLNYSAIEEDGSVIAYSVSKGEAADPEIVIPAEHEGKPVTMIGNFAFQTCEGLTEITVGKGVTEFGNQAFGGCKNLSVIKYNGTKAQWEKITKGPSWDFNVGLTTNRSYTIICTDETILVEDEW